MKLLLNIFDTLLYGLGIPIVIYLTIGIYNSQLLGPINNLLGLNNTIGP